MKKITKKDIRDVAKKYGLDADFLEDAVNDYELYGIATKEDLIDYVEDYVIR